MNRVYKRILAILLSIVFIFGGICLNTINVCAEDDYYTDIEFVGDEIDEMQHLLFAKLVYDYLDGYEGKLVSEYVKDHPELYHKEIWESSGITYESLYCSLVGDWTVYQVFNQNSKSGFYAVAFVSGEQVVLAFRGSEMFTDEFPLNESNDWIYTDFKFAILNKLSRQFEDAYNAYTRLNKLLKQDKMSDKTITFAGHSLGGALVTYASLTTGHYGYSYDGACGHVVDLIYYYEYLDIVDFHGIDDEESVKFCNYTDAEEYMVADLIQHTNSEFIYQIDRTTYVDGLCENDWISKIADAQSHIIWSCLSYEDNKVFFNLVETAYEPEGQGSIFINKNIIEAAYEGFSSATPWMVTLIKRDYKYVIDVILSSLKNDGKVCLAGCDGGDLYAKEDSMFAWFFPPRCVMLGGRGDDNIYGYIADDVLIGGEGKDFLDGEKGRDTYVIDYVIDSPDTISDASGEKTTIILRNMHLKDLKELSLEDESGCLSIRGEQEIYLDLAQGDEDVDIFAYDAYRLNYLGTLADIR